MIVGQDTRYRVVLSSINYMTADKVSVGRLPFLRFSADQPQKFEFSILSSVSIGNFHITSAEDAYTPDFRCGIP